LGNFKGSEIGEQKKNRVNATRGKVLRKEWGGGGLGVEKKNPLRKSQPR